MIRVESTAQGLSDIKSTIIKSIAVLAVIACFIINLIYGLCRYFYSIGFGNYNENWLNTFRLFVFCWMLGWVGLIFLTLAIFRMIRSPQKDRQSAPEKIKSPLWWKIFEIGTWLLIPTVIILYTIKYDAFEPLFQVNYNLISWANSASVTNTIDRLEDACLFLLFFYLTIKIPILVGKLLSTFNRTYVGNWRLHESVFGIAWFIVGCLLVLYGDFNDRVIGILYILPGVFLVGRDYLDVMHFKIIEHHHANQDEIEEKKENES